MIEIKERKNIRIQYLVFRTRNQYIHNTYYTVSGKRSEIHRYEIRVSEKVNETETEMRTCIIIIIIIMID